MILLSGKQCKTARLLLKWNLRELAFRSGIRMKSLDLFEHSTKQLVGAEKENLGKIFRKEGVVFLDFGEVRLEDAASVSIYAHGNSNSGDQVTYTVDENDYAALSNDERPERRQLPEGEEAATR